MFDADYDAELSPISQAKLKSVDDAPSLIEATRDHQAIEVAFWESICEDDDGIELRLYLDRYPEGSFSDLARARLEGDAKALEDTAVEVSFWESVRTPGTRRLIEAYLQRYPSGEFASLARILLDSLDG